jgi:hypothetical protein
MSATRRRAGCTGTSVRGRLPAGHGRAQQDSPCGTATRPFLAANCFHGKQSPLRAAPSQEHRFGTFSRLDCKLKSHSAAGLLMRTHIAAVHESGALGPYTSIASALVSLGCTADVPAGIGVARDRRSSPSAGGCDPTETSCESLTSPARPRRKPRNRCAVFRAAPDAGGVCVAAT